MELEFDKEMDAMLRKAGRSGVLVGDTAKLHLDADAINAFAENALPEKSRRIYTEHLAECDPCRKTLSGLILMNAEAEPETAAAVVAPTILASIPWYRKLFMAPNLAYTFGGLILLFGGLIGFVALQNFGTGSTATVSQLTESKADRSSEPAAPPMAAASNANASANAANSAINAAGEIPHSVGMSEMPTDGSTANISPPPPAPLPVLSAPSTTAASNSAAPSGSVSTDGISVTGGQPTPKEAIKSADESRLRVEDKKIQAEREESRKQDLDLNARSANQNQNQFPMPGNSKDYAGPNRGNQRDNRAYDDAPAAKAKAKKAEAPSAGSRMDSSSSRRTAGGKTFELKQGAWYDTSYSTQPIIRVGRGTDEYRKLDSGLRSIADNIGGLVVVVWKGKAYRIQ